MSQKAHLQQKQKTNQWVIISKKLDKILKCKDINPITGKLV